MAEIENVSDLSKEEKVAILVSSLGEDMAGRVLENMSSGNVRKLEGGFARIGPLDGEIVEVVTREFLEFVDHRQSPAAPAQEVKEAVKKNVKTEHDGKEKALFDVIEDMEADLSREDNEPIAKDVKARGKMDEKSLFEVLENMESKVLADFTKGEHPQTIAVILAHLEPTKAGEVLSSLPEALQSDVIFRLAQLETVPSSTVKEVAEALEDQVQSVGRVERKIGGIKTVTSILNQTAKSLEKNILARIEEIDSDLSERIKQDLFAFEDLVKVDDRGIREVLKEITTMELALALKAASDEVKEKVFRNMSDRASEMLQEDMEALGPTRLSDVEKAQQAITRIALKLEGEGKILVGGRGTEEILV
jgi:flagellar motor switch protein FliG